MKLSKAQEQVIDKAKAEIDRARKFTLTEWAAYKKNYDSEIKIEHIVSIYIRNGLTPEQARARIDQEIAEYADTYKEYYENERNGIVLTHCNSRTLKKLEELGLIEILFDSTNTHFGIDTIKLLNY